MKIKYALCYLVFVSSFFARAADVPGGQLRSAEPLSMNHYELLFSPAFGVGEQAGSYFSSKLRYQAYQSLGLGFAFGGGNSGFHFGVEGTWNLKKEGRDFPSISLQGGLYYTHLTRDNFLVPRIGPIISRAFEVGSTLITPYAGVHLAPSFSLSRLQPEFSSRISGGVRISPYSNNDIQMWTELSVGLRNSPSEIAVAVSYPFAAL